MGIHISWVLFSFMCIGLVHGTLEGCQLVVGGEFIYSDTTGEITSGLVQYDITSQAMHPFGNTYKDAQLTSIYEQGGSLYFSGNVVRVRDDDSVAIGSYNLDEDTLTGMDTGLWTLGNSLPSGDSALSPTLLFAPLGEDIVIAGHFTHQNSQPNVILNNIAMYSPSGGSYTALEDVPCSMNSCSIISLATDEQSERIFVATMSIEVPYTTEVSVFENGRWTSLPLPEGATSSFRILFDSLVLSNNSTLSSVSYIAGAMDSLEEAEIDYHLISWDLEDIDARPSSTIIYQKSCFSNGQVAFPAISGYSGGSIISVLPESSCPNGNTPVNFRKFAGETAVEMYPSIPDANVAKQLIAVSEELAYFSNGTALYSFYNGEWRTLLLGVTSMYIHYSASEETIFVTYNYGHQSYCASFPSNSVSERVLFSGHIYSAGTIRTIVDLNEGKFLVGGDFKFIGREIVNAKFAALWDGSKWKPTLESNSDSYLPGWVLLSAEAIGDTVFAIADAGEDVDSLPVLKWNEDHGWLFLYNRPSNIDPAGYNNKYGTVYIDHTRDQIYFGGEFTAGISGESCSGAVIYHYLEERWSCLPANLTRVNTFASLNAHSYLQVGGLFSFTDENMVNHENYLILDVNENQILSSVPSVADSEVFTLSLFPDQPQYSFVGGNFGQYGVEQLRYMSSIWSLSVVGNTPLKPVVYALTARNGEPSLFAGGSFSESLSKLDIMRQEWTSIIPNGLQWEGDVRSLLITCPADADYYSFASAWDDTSLMGSFYSAPDCTIPPDAPDDFTCNPSLSTGAIIGLCTTVLVTIVILSVIGYFAFKVIKERAKDEDDSIEYI